MDGKDRWYVDPHRALFSAEADPEADLEVDLEVDLEAERRSVICLKGNFWSIVSCVPPLNSDCLLGLMFFWCMKSSQIGMVSSEFKTRLFNRMISELLVEPLVELLVELLVEQPQPDCPRKMKQKWNLLSESLRVDLMDATRPISGTNQLYQLR